MGDFSPFSIAAGLALCEVLDPHRCLGVKLKWPNDILVGDRKLAGILITTNLVGPLVETATVGIGLDVVPHPELPDTAISLSELDVDASRNLDRTTRLIMSALSFRYSAICRGDQAEALRGWADYLAFLDRQVELEDGDVRFVGELSGIDLSGALLLSTAHGPVTVTAGELTRGPRPEHPTSR